MIESDVHLDENKICRIPEKTIELIIDLFEKLREEKKKKTYNRRNEI